MLKFLFAWFDHHPSAYWGIAAVPTAFLLVLVGVGFWRDESAEKSRWSDRLFAAVAVVFLFAWRWPFLLEPQAFNLDEGQLIAGAKTLLHDPVFWRSVDGTTSGPLNFAALLPLSLLGLPLDYFSARLTGLILVSAALLSCYGLFRRFAPPPPARLALIPALFFFATAADPDFVHYSSEHVALLLLALAACGLLRPPGDAETGGAGRLLGGFCAGLLPWAKIQTAPLAIALVGGGLWLVFASRAVPPARRTRAAGLLLLGFVAPSLLGFLTLVLTGQFGEFVQDYLQQNFFYAGQGIPLASTLGALRDFAAPTQAYPAFLSASLLTLVLSSTVYARLRRRPERLFYVGAGGTLVAGICILAPHRAFVHYLLLSVIPLMIWAGAPLLERWRDLRLRPTYGLGLLLIGCGWPLGLRLTHPAPAMFGRLAESWRHPYSTVGAILRKNAVKDEALGLWGWRTDLYVESGLRQATRDAHTFWLITESPHRDDYRARYLADLQRNRPQFFVDSVGPGAFTFQHRATEGHEIFPALSEYLDRNYTLVFDSGAERVYASAEFQGRASGPLPAARRRQPVEPERDEAVLSPANPERTEPANLGYWNIDENSVRMLLPPGRMVWSLDGTEREVLLAYGFHPRAYTEGSTNGADFIAELISPGHEPRLVFSCHLDPVKRAADRGTRATRVPLPPLAPGTQLVVRSEPGEGGNDAWDWVYLGWVKFVRAPSYTHDQFPGFALRPDAAEANDSVLVGGEHDRILLVNAPSALTYRLDGTERRLGLTFGFDTGIDLQANAGARLRVEAVHGLDPVRVLFERSLHPFVNQVDRGRHRAELSLPPGHAGDRLVLRLIAEGGDATRGIYVTDLTLE